MLRTKESARRRLFLSFLRGAFLAHGWVRGYNAAMPLWSRPDGVRITGVAPYRRIMPFLMPGRNESVVFFDQSIDLTKTNPFIEEFNSKAPYQATLFHLILWAVAQTLHEWPKLNRFIVGKRLYQHTGIWLSFSAKKRFDENAPLVVVKRLFDPKQSFSDTVCALHEEIRKGRSDEKSHVDKELSVFLKLPRTLLWAGVVIVKALDYFNLLPAGFIEGDPMYASLFVANLGSLGLDAAYHHLYEYGTIPVFMAVGRIAQRPVVVQAGKVEVRTVLPIRYSFDERIEDGFYCTRALDRLKTIVEDPKQYVT